MLLLMALLGLSGVCVCHQHNVARTASTLGGVMVTTGVPALGATAADRCLVMKVCVRSSQWWASAALLPLLMLTDFMQAASWSCRRMALACIRTAWLHAQLN